MPLLFSGMVDQLAMAITTKVRIDSKGLTKMGLSSEPTWSDVKPFVGVHADARTCISEIMNNAEDDLKTAVLLIHFYHSYDATPVISNDEEDEPVDDYGSNDYDDNY
jgi:hypothetical protein